MSTIRHEQAGKTGADAFPSPSLWNRFRMTRITEHGLGFAFHEDFLGVAKTETFASGEPRINFGPFAMDCDDDTVITGTDELGGQIDIETDGDDNDACALFTLPCFRTTLFSSKPWAFEAMIESGDVADDFAWFVGLAEYAALHRDVIADNGTDVDTESMVGFIVKSGDPNSVDAVYRLDTGTTVELTTDVTNNAAITAGGGTVGDLASDTPKKFGMRFDGKETLEVFVDGYKVHAETLSSTTFPDDVNMGMIIAVKTGDGQAESIGVGWARGAYEQRT